MALVDLKSDLSLIRPKNPDPKKEGMDVNKFPPPTEKQGTKVSYDRNGVVDPNTQLSERSGVPLSEMVSRFAPEDGNTNNSQISNRFGPPHPPEHSILDIDGTPTIGQQTNFNIPNPQIYSNPPDAPTFVDTTNPYPISTMIVDYMSGRKGEWGPGTLPLGFTSNMQTSLLSSGGDVTITPLTWNINGITSEHPFGNTGDFSIDSQNNIWYTNWVPDTNGLLLKFNIEKYKQDSFLQSTGIEIDVENYFDVYDFPLGLNAANGLSIDENDNVWIVDTTSSFFFKFDPNTKQFTKFITSPPQKSAYGNATGIIKSPISRPYWSQTDMNGNLFFNEQTSNQIAVYDIKNSYLVEYMVPSKNPNWADCDVESSSNCGVAQIFGFDAIDGQIWFTEWAENKIGVVDIKKPLPFSVSLDKDLITLKKGEPQTIILNIDSSSNAGKINFNFAHTASTATASSDIQISHTMNNSNEILVTVTANPIALAGDYKLLLGVYNSEVNVSKYIDVIIEP